MHPLRVGPLVRKQEFREIRRAMESNHSKSEVQVGALVDFPLVTSRETWNELAGLAARLSAETLAAETEIFSRPDLYVRLALPRPLRRLFPRDVPTPAAARIMRFDFHYTSSGWQISDVNSDVPGGFTEATSFTQLMASAGGATPAGDPTCALVDALVRIVGDKGTVALTSAPNHIEDYQVVAYIAAGLRARGITAHIVSPSEFRWRDGRARIETPQYSCDVGAVYRFYQAGWLAHLARYIEWPPLFVGGRTPVANPGIAALSESKRLPLAWSELRCPLPTWRRMLPETRALADAPWEKDESWLIKSAFSNCGETVSIRSMMSATAWTWRVWCARLRSSQWVAQRRFTILPVMREGKALFPCIGVYTIDGIAAGAYARIASGPLIDAHARDAALLVEDA